MNKNDYKETKYNQPLILQRADPYVYKSKEGTYYFTASVPAYDKVVLRSADTVKGLAEAEERTLWVKHEEGPRSIHIWAPEIHYVDGGWYIYYAAGDKDDIWEIRPYVLHCKGQDPMKDEWEELGMMQAADEDEFSFHAFSLDATIFEHKGEYYYIWAEKTGVGKQISNLYIEKIGNMNKLATDKVLVTTRDDEGDGVDF